MTLGPRVWKERSAGAWGRLRGPLWGIAVGLLMAGLAFQALGARQETSRLRRERAELARRIEALRRANQALRDEVRALENDPVYVESVLRGWKQVAQGERLID
ncbi:MAG TPA: septum formation initiator family protein [Planctomycetota bacterium]|nr:septum formation initiator family protein [Planctomycetota bacterium]